MRNNIGRLIVAIISDLFEEAAIVIIVLWGLPRLGIHIPLAGLIALMVVWAAISVLIYLAGSRALCRKPEPGLPDMTGSKGKVVSPLAPEGLISIRGELWVAKSINGDAGMGEEVNVVEREGLKLIVRKETADGSN